MNPNFSPLNEEQSVLLEKLFSELSPLQLSWLGGFIQGKLFSDKLEISNSDEASAVGEVASAVPKELTIVYGTHTGHSESVARWAEEIATNQQIKVRLFAMDDYNVRQIGNEKNLLVIVSTHGEGEPPLMAEDFYHFITGKRVPDLSNLNYAVLGLGDRTYRNFCQTGIDIDQALKKAGANALADLVKCDVDFEDSAREWAKNIIGSLAHSVKSETSSLSIPKRSVDDLQFSRKNPYRAKVLEKIKITGRTSEKEVYHVELSLDHSGLTYSPGDSLGIFADNPPVLVETILRELKLDPDSNVNLKGSNYQLDKVLRYQLEITVLTIPTLQAYAKISQNADLQELINNEERLADYLWGHDLLDLIHDFPFPLNAQQLVDLLRILPPRMYSISSSQDIVGDEVHITVATVRYTKKGRDREGAASTFIADRINEDHKIPIFIEHNAAFRLPTNSKTPVIMIGAGTGIAPFRAFTQQRESEGIKGNSWLFFGEQHFQSDFLYQLEWQKYLKTGVLEKINMAFSRDQTEKIYVQDRLAQEEADVFDWIKKGANIYICGDRKKMAKDVQDTLLKIIQNQGGISADQAKDYLKQLKKEKRLQLDIY